MGAFGVSLPRGSWTLGANLRYTGERIEINSYTNTHYYLKSFSVLDLKVQCALTKELTATARIDNVFDTEYQTAYGYNQSRTGAYVGLLWAQK